VVSAKLDAAAELSASGALPENVNYAVKSSYLLSFLESVPEVSAKLKEANGKEIKFEEVVEKAKQAAVLVLVYRQNDGWQNDVAEFPSKMILSSIILSAFSGAVLVLAHCFRRARQSSARR
jgi:hypothetical protein